MIRLGINSVIQNTPELVPSDFLIEDLDIPKFVGKTPIEINARKVVVRRVNIKDVWHPNNQDSKCIWIGNTTGDILIEWCDLEGASECIMSGGDTLKIINGFIKDIIIRDSVLHKDLAWKGVHAVKNILELKNAHNVLLERLRCYNCWAGGQPGGYCFMFTPASGGSLQNVVVKDCDVSNVGGIVNITGIDAAGKNTIRSQVTFQGGTYKTNKTDMGGRGDFALLGRGPEYLDVFDCEIVQQSNHFIYVGDGDPIERITVQRCKANIGKYGININGNMYGGNPLGQVRKMIIVENTFIGASATFKKNFPNNIYI